MISFSQAEQQYLEPIDPDEIPIETCTECGEELFEDDCVNEDCEEYWDKE